MHKKAIYNLAVGITLKELHEENRIDRAKLATALEISEFGVNKIENGSERMTAGELILALELFDIPWDDFMARVTSNMPRAKEMMV